ncbi:MAG: MATE family efflux transporter [Planctomycetales bacterium]|nr:MATE family efflux transporter [Planctomycetales bacterium]
MNPDPPLPTGTLRPLFALALPVMAEESLNLLVGYTDWWLAGHFLPGEEPKAAMGLMSYVLWILPTLFSLISIGAMALVARFVGAGMRKEASHVVNQAMLLGVIAAGIGIFFFLVGGPWFVSAMQLRPEAAELALRYIRIMTPAIPAIMLEQIGSACLRGSGDAVTGLIARVVLNAVNMILATLLVTGAGPFPNLGWDGLAIGTATGHMLGGLIILGMLLRGRNGMKLSLGWPRPDWATIRRVLRIGLPGGCDASAVVFCHLVYVSIINALGTEASAAHGLGLQIEALAYAPGSAFHVAAATMAGQALGAGQPQRAVRSVVIAANCGVAVMSLAGLLFFFAGEQLAQFFIGHSSGLTLHAGELLKIVACGCPALAILNVLTGGLRGSGDTRVPLAITFIGLVGIRIPLACFLAWDQIPLPFTGITLPGLGLGVGGAWLAMVTDATVRSLLAMVRFWQGGWKEVNV